MRLILLLGMFIVAVPVAALAQDYDPAGALYRGFMQGADTADRLKGAAHQKRMRQMQLQEMQQRLEMQRQELIARQQRIEREKRQPPTSLRPQVKTEPPAFQSFTEDKTFWTFFAECMKRLRADDEDGLRDVLMARMLENGLDDAGLAKSNAERAYIKFGAIQDAAKPLKEVVRKK